MGKRKRRECVTCKHMKGLEDNHGDTIYFCMNTDSPCYREETGHCGWCDTYGMEEDEDNDNAGQLV